ncbi:MAG: hypothetical protein GX567_09645 [Clostridia bacterium]|nr:hypothetical protein [Clostridia bacterium]
MGKKKKTKIEGDEVVSYIMKVIITIYAYILVVSTGLFYHDKYFDIGDFKYEMFFKITIVMLIFAAITGVILLIMSRKKLSFKQLPDKLSTLDLFVIGYACLALSSYFLSSYPQDALYGYNGWKMGLISQLMFVAIYFLVSRFWMDSWMPDFLVMLFGSSAFVFLFAILHRFMIDPLALYEGVDSKYYIEFLTTIGQATWYSSFLCIVLPIGVVVLWKAEKKWVKICMTIYCFLGFSTLVTQNSDSAFIALATLMFVLFCFSFDSNKDMLRFLLIVILCIGSMRIMGILQLLFPGQAVELDTISVVCSQNVIMWPVLLIVILLYFYLRNREKKQMMDVGKVIWLKRTALIALPTGLILIFLLIYLNTNQLLPPALAFLNKIPYLYFDEGWGNTRGGIWMYSAKMFSEFPLKEKLFGVGPDSFAAYTYEFYKKEAESTWGSILTNAHCEWFNLTICTGIFGGIAYLGTFISAAVTFTKNRARNTMIAAAGLSIFCYIFHNIFCYQQVICTPIIFLFMGIGSHLCRTKEQA